MQGALADLLQQHEAAISAALSPAAAAASSTHSDPKLLSPAGLRSIIKQASLVELHRDSSPTAAAAASDQQQQQPGVAAAAAGSSKADDVAAWALELLKGDSWRVRAQVALAHVGGLRCGQRVVLHVDELMWLRWCPRNVVCLAMQFRL